MKRGRDQFKKVRPLLRLLESFFRLFPQKIRIKLFERKRYAKGLYGIGIRYALLRSIALHCGENVSIQPNVFLLRPENISIGDNVSIHPMCYIDADGGITIGNDVSIAHAVTIMSTTHLFSDPQIPIKDQGVSSAPVTISDNVWIGAKATILCGRTIGERSVIGTGAVITRDVPGGTVSAGVPARQIKKI